MPCMHQNVQPDFRVFPPSSPVHSLGELRLVDPPSEGLCLGRRLTRTGRPRAGGGLRLDQLVFDLSLDPL
jgi:hypothetical protein